MNPGFLKIYRKFFAHPLWAEPRTFSRSEAFLDLLQLAAFTPTRRLCSGKMVELGVGQLIGSERYLGDRWHWSTTKVRDFLSVLYQDGMLSIEKKAGGSILTLCNYERYASEQSFEKAQKKQEKSAEKAQKKRIEEGEEGEEGKSEDSSQALPRGWQRMGKAEQARKRVNFNDDTMIRIGGWFKQRPTTLWSIADASALQELSPDEDDLKLIGEHYSYEIENNGYRFKTIETLLNKWPAARAKANAFFDENPHLPRP